MKNLEHCAKVLQQQQDDNMERQTINLALLEEVAETLRNIEFVCPPSMLHTPYHFMCKAINAYKALEKNDFAEAKRYLMDLLIGVEKQIPSDWKNPPKAAPILSKRHTVAGETEGKDYEHFTFDTESLFDFANHNFSQEDFSQVNYRPSITTEELENILSTNSQSPAPISPFDINMIPKTPPPLKRVGSPVNYSFTKRTKLHNFEENSSDGIDAGSVINHAEDLVKNQKTVNTININSGSVEESIYFKNNNTVLASNVQVKQTRSASNTSNTPTARSRRKALVFSCNYNVLSFNYGTVSYLRSKLKKDKSSVFISMVHPDIPDEDLRQVWNSLRESLVLRDNVKLNNNRSVLLKDLETLDTYKHELTTLFEQKGFVCEQLYE
ncbi:hypothetical protein [Clostera anachoreta granulovirus]|uniref:Uncharacterized protein n=1 Tax=Clostera anachoreta granulovirus TaxID=283675 RepID=F4ZKR5_9BBAC|nr:hypothetical protein ClanGV_gp038 [Clostera anachoreta granulovirus]AEB00326.1 hypothetical protein [Clostera anachoreta granulovirus]